MKFKLVEESELDLITRKVLELKHTPFYFSREKNTVLVNADMPSPERAIEAFTTILENSPESDTGEAAYQSLEALCGTQAVAQAMTIISDLRREAIEKNALAQANEWLTERFNLNTVDELNGYDPAVLKAIDMALVDRHGYSKARGLTLDAIFLYGYECGKEAR